MDKKTIEFYLKTLPMVSNVWKMCWRLKGKPVPPPHAVKEDVVKEYVKKYRYSTFIETGTRHGYMVFALRNYFKKIVSIELSHSLAEMCINRFKKYEHIAIIEGDSSVELPAILEKINEKCIFWLDAHYSAGETAKGDLMTPINKEMECILTHKIKDHILLIDDARDFDGTDDYPKLAEFERSIKQLRSDLTFKVKNDVICIEPVKTLL